MAPGNFCSLNPLFGPAANFLSEYRRRRDSIFENTASWIFPIRPVSINMHGLFIFRVLARLLLK
jgi:hypothetical protein